MTDSFYDQTATKAEFLRIIDTLSEGNYEVMCHPGYVDAGLIASSGYSRPRQVELSILIDPSIWARIEERGIQLISFNLL